MIAEDNSLEEIGLRRYKTELATAGIGYIFLGLWSVVKVVMSTFFGEMSFDREFSDMEISPEDYLPVAIIYFFVIAFVTGFLFLLHIYIGRGAIRASKGGKKKGYLVITVVVMIFVIVGCILDITNLVTGQPSDVERLVATTIVDITVLSILWGILHSNHMIKKLTRQQKAKGLCT